MDVVIVQQLLIVVNGIWCLYITDQLLKNLYIVLVCVTMGSKERDYMISPTAQKQIEMHADFFDRTMFAIENGFYLEAMFREYAAIEGRLEILLGVLGAPCNKNLPFQQRKDMKVSHRVRCLSKYYKQDLNIGISKLTPAYFKALENWIKARNLYIHGLYKNEVEYQERCEQCKTMAEEGLSLARMLYNEVKRLRRYIKNHPEIELPAESICRSKNCASKLEQ